MTNISERIGTVSYNIYCNFTNYGSALQTWALHQALKKLGTNPVLVDYCPDILRDKNPLNPFKNMWDKDEESRRMVELTMPAIKANYVKFDRFYHEKFNRTKKSYTSNNFGEVTDEVDSFVCGSDTIFCPDEFGFDDGYYANYSCMKGNSIAYAASFGDPHFKENDYEILSGRIKNFKAIGLREQMMIPYVSGHSKAPVQKVLDPTLLLTREEYDGIATDRLIGDPYILLYARRYNPAMEAYAERLAAENGWKIVEISLRATNAEKGHLMFYEAGVEEFLSLVKHAEYIVTNSYHGMIMSLQYQRDFVVFSREQCDTKIEEVLDMVGLRDRILVKGDEKFRDIDFDAVHRIISRERSDSLNFLKRELELLSIKEK